MRDAVKIMSASKRAKAPPKGLEPLTDWLTASRSTWLSYGGNHNANHFQFYKTI
jgi:hypothetical protein